MASLKQAIVSQAPVGVSVASTHPAVRKLCPLKVDESLAQVTNGLGPDVSLAHAPVPRSNSHCIQRLNILLVHRSREELTSALHASCSTCSPLQYRRMPRSTLGAPRACAD